MVISIGTTFPPGWQYGPEEISIFSSTTDQVQQSFPDQRNLVINTTWFGPQFDNGQWEKVQQLIEQGYEFDNLFLLAAIDPVYLSPRDQEYIVEKLKIKQLYQIGMYADSKYEWNFHSVVVNERCPKYPLEHLLMDTPDYVFLLYQRKPRQHRIEITNILVERGYDRRGIITLGSTATDNQAWGDGQSAPLLTIDDSPANYKHNGNFNDFGGIPNDLVSLGRMDIWKHHFLNIISETEFNEWHPRFITEKTWKPIIGLRPYIVHGQRSIYSWLRTNGFRTFNQYWAHIPVETSEDQHGSVISVIDFLCNKSAAELNEMYQCMLPDLLYNKNRYIEFAAEQKYKMGNLFSQ